MRLPEERIRRWQGCETGGRRGPSGTGLTFVAALERIPHGPQMSGTGARKQQCTTLSMVCRSNEENRLDKSPKHAAHRLLNLFRSTAKKILRLRLFCSPLATASTGVVATTFTATRPV